VQPVLDLEVDVLGHVPDRVRVEGALFAQLGLSAVDDGQSRQLEGRKAAQDLVLVLVEAVLEASEGSTWCTRRGA
jgi:hypothetical protein